MFVYYFHSNDLPENFTSMMDYLAKAVEDGTLTVGSHFSLSHIQVLGFLILFNKLSAKGKGYFSTQHDKFLQWLAKLVRVYAIQKHRQAVAQDPNARGTRCCDVAIMRGIKVVKDSLKKAHTMTAAFQRDARALAAMDLKENPDYKKATVYV